MRRLSLGVVTVTFTVALAACGSGAPAPSATIGLCPGESPPGKQLLCPTTGTAHVDVTGVRQASFDAPFDPEGPGLRSGLLMPDGVMQLAFRDRSHLPTDAFSFAGATTTLEPQHPAVVNVVVGGEFFTGSQECTITLTRGDATGVSGTFSCAGMESIGGSSSTIDATGTFVASP